MHKPADEPRDGSSHPSANQKTGLLAAWQAAGGDLKDPRWIYLKGFLFLMSGILAASLLLIEHPTWKDAALLAMTVWCFSRFYYFAFYVIEHYVDSKYKFAGLGSFVMYLLRRKS
jgi:hypothetical protein